MDAVAWQRAIQGASWTHRLCEWRRGCDTVMRKKNRGREGEKEPEEEEEEER